jgi:glucose-6-phosphate 1-dehydrogenase
MNTWKSSDPTCIVIFGAGGDLTRRKLIPSLYSLFLAGKLPDRFLIAGLDRKSASDEDFRRQLRHAIETFTGQPVDDARWREFAASISFVKADLDDPSAYASLKTRLEGVDKGWNARAGRIFYMAVPPMAIATIAERLGRSQLCADAARARIVVEKPFGRDLESGRALNRTLTGIFRESQIYRIDHYLGKETVQNILAFRFANALFEPIWDRRYIDHVQVTMAEQVGIEHRGSYYDEAGALRDMVQNHLMQILCLIAMEPPVSFQDEEVRNKKVDVLHAIRPIRKDHVHQFAVRGQYGEGWIEGKRVAAYREEPGVSTASSTETFAAVKLFVDNWRWQDVPFYLRTGKRLPARVVEVFIRFRPVPHQSFPSSAVEAWQQNALVIRIQPEEGILLRFQAKHPGQHMSLSQVDMRFSYCEAFRTTPSDAYETLLLDVMLGDATLFMRADQVEAGWAVVSPILEGWQDITPSDFPNYQAGSWGPAAADVLIAQDGRSWLLPTILEDKNLHPQDPAACLLPEKPSPPPAAKPRSVVPIAKPGHRAKGRGPRSAKRLRTGRRSK